jgi:hypothetical protein
MFSRLLLNNLYDLKCEQCKEKLNFEDFQNNGHIKCVKCNFLNDPKKAIEAFYSAHEAKKTEKPFDKTQYSASYKFKQYQLENENVIERDWNAPGRGFTTGLAIAINILLVFGLYFLLFKDTSNWSTPDIFLAEYISLTVGFLPYAAIAIYFSFKTLQFWFNSTKMFIGNSQVRIKNGPFKIKNRNLVFNRVDIDNMSIEKIENGNLGDTPIYSYQLKIHLKSRATHVVFHQIDLNDAIAIEKIFESSLNIKDNPALDVS